MTDSAETAPAVAALLARAWVYVEGREWIDLG